MKQKKILEEERDKEILSRNGKEQPFKLYQEMADVMKANVLVIYYDDKLRQTIEKLKELKQRVKDIKVPDKNPWSNQSVTFVKQLEEMLDLSYAITLSALTRKERRGALYKPEYPKRDDENWLVTSKAKYNPEKDEPEMDLSEKVDTSLIKPVQRKYD